MKGAIQANLKKKNKNNNAMEPRHDIPEPIVPTAEGPSDEDEDEMEEGTAPTRILSKKEKEKLKKEREKVTYYCVELHCKSA